MRSTVKPKRWFAAWRAARSRASAAGDAADQGTAFGLEMSLQPLTFDDTPAPPPRHGLMRRLTGRKVRTKPADPSGPSDRARSRRKARP